MHGLELEKYLTALSGYDMTVSQKREFLSALVDVLEGIIDGRYFPESATEASQSQSCDNMDCGK